ncbi:MAG: class I SAM-dependent methyltransferase [Sphingomonadales bacterium]
MSKINPVAGSFRDPGGQVFLKNNRVFRTVTKVAADDFDFVEKSGLVAKLEGRGQIVSSKKVSKTVFGSKIPNLHTVLEHEKIPFISYPYEWPVQQLRKAAILQLDIMLLGLKHGVTLSDASAYNFQFIGSRPVLIDRLSLVPYVEGEIWVGYRQFCEQFLFPLILAATFNFPYHSWYRGELGGIPLASMAKLIPFSKRFSPGVFKHVILQNLFQTKGQGLAKGDSAEGLKKIKLKREIFQANLESMKKLISKLKLGSKAASEWQNYDVDHSYDSEEEKAKIAFIQAFAKKTKPEILWDLGCNTGAYSEAAITAGAGYVVGFDSDLGALAKACQRAEKFNHPLLPLYMNLGNVSPNQGWNQAEREGMAGRGPAGGLLALALVHHLAIAGNIPLSQVIDWLVRMAPTGVIEFVPKNDDMVKSLLALREDIFSDYTADDFEKYLGARAKIVKKLVCSKSGRTLYWYKI